MYIYMRLNTGDIRKNDNDQRWLVGQVGPHQKRK